jgi:hypothetical protein
VAEESFHRAEGSFGVGEEENSGAVAEENFHQAEENFHRVEEEESTAVEVNSVVEANIVVEENTVAEGISVAEVNTVVEENSAVEKNSAVEVKGRNITGGHILLEEGENSVVGDVVQLRMKNHGLVKRCISKYELYYISKITNIIDKPY